MGDDKMGLNFDLLENTNPALYKYGSEMEKNMFLR